MDTGMAGWRRAQSMELPKETPWQDRPPIQVKRTAQEVLAAKEKASGHLRKFHDQSFTTELEEIVKRTASTPGTHSPNFLPTG